MNGINLLIDELQHEQKVKINQVSKCSWQHLMYMRQMCFLKEKNLEVKCDALKPYPEGITETVVRKHNCCIFSFCAHCHNQHTWMGNKSFKTHATSCKKANKKTYYQNFWSHLFSFIIAEAHKTRMLSWISSSHCGLHFVATLSAQPCFENDF